MSYKGKTHFNVTWVVDSGDEAEWDRIFASHAAWMQGHPRQGEAALLSYSVSKGPELSNPLDPNSEPTGKTMYVLDEYYESPVGVARHWQDGMENWADDLGAVMKASAKATTVTTLHSGTVTQGLW
jgi:hypothetical protein